MSKTRPHFLHIRILFLDEYDSLMEESEKWAKEVGMKQSDIDDAIKSIRKKGSH